MTDNKLLSPLPLPSAPFTRTHRADTRSSAATTTASTAEVLDPDPVTSKILKAVTDLGNTVLAKRAAGELHSIKGKKPPQFQDDEVFRKVLWILERHHFRLPVCRFVIDLFDRKVLRRIVLEEDDDDDKDDDTENTTQLKLEERVGVATSGLANETKLDSDEGDSSSDDG